MDSTIVSALGPVLTAAAVAGAVALVFRLGRALLRLGLNAAESTAARSLADLSARRGDLTGMAERREARAVLRRRRRREAFLALLWAALLVVPPMLGLAREVFAAGALLWLLPRRPVRPSGPRTD